MSSIEERLARDIAAVAGGVVVTEADLREARSAVNERIASRRRRDRLRTVTVGAAAAAVLAAVGTTAFLALDGDDETARLAGPGAGLPDPDADYLTGSAPTVELLVGVWRVDNGVTVVKFDQDGTVRFDDHGTLFSDPVTTGTYAVDGDLITVTTRDDDQTGCIGTTLALRASFPERGAMRFVPSDTSGACAPLPPGRGVLEQVLPTSRSMAELVLSADLGWKPLSDEAVLNGVWLAEGGGHVLEMDPGGAYYIADDSGEPIDSGQWSLLDADLMLTSSAGSAACGEGDRFVLGSVEWIDAGTSAIRGTVKENACGGAWTPVAWLLIPHV